MTMPESAFVALSLGGGLPRLDLSVDALRRLRSRKLLLVLTSDAHHASELERVKYAALNAERAGIEPERVVNTWPKERLTAWAVTGTA